MSAIVAHNFGEAWRDAYGNSFAHLVDYAVCMIINAEPAAWEYEAELWLPLVLKKAVDQIQQARGRKLHALPVPKRPI